MNHFSKHTTRLMLLVAALWFAGANANAAFVTVLVDLATPDDSELNRLGIAGTLNTLAQGLGAVDCGTAGISAQGAIRAEVTFETNAQRPLQLVSVNFLSSNFQQEDVSLFYDVPNTTRRVTFSTSNLGFGINFDNNGNNNGAPVPSPITSSLTVASDFSTLPINPSTYDMHQNGGTAKVEVTNRPPAVQNLLADPAVSVYGLPAPNPVVDLGSLTLYPPNQFTEFYEIVLRLPLNYQRVVYSGTGLPVTLNYSGSLTLYSELPQIVVNVPEPSAILLGYIGLAMLVSRRLKRTG